MYYDVVRGLGVQDSTQNPTVIASKEGSSHWKGQEEVQEIRRRGHRIHNFNECIDGQGVETVRKGNIDWYETLHVCQDGLLWTVKAEQISSWESLAAGGIGELRGKVSKGLYV